MALTEVIAEPNSINWNRTAKSELEAAEMAWDLYLYIRELESRLNALKPSVSAAKE